MMYRYKKKLSQNFLIDNNIAQKIVNSLTFKKYNNIVEVGPGFGVLSKYFFKKKINKILLIEIDDQLVFYLKKKYPNFNNNIIHYDFLKWNPVDFNICNFAIIGNFPYKISSQILFKIINMYNNVIECVGMFQKEVADRIISNKNKKTYGILSVLMQTFYHVEYLFTVNSTVFRPIPRVKSSVLRFSKKKISKFNKKLFIKIIKASFNQRRKILRNSLKCLNFNKLFYSNTILNKRAENLSTDDFICITNYAYNLM